MHAVNPEDSGCGAAGLLDADAGSLLQKLMMHVPEANDAQIAVHAAHLQHAAALPATRLVCGALWVRVPTKSSSFQLIRVSNTPSIRLGHIGCGWARACQSAC